MRFLLIMAAAMLTACETIYYENPIGDNLTTVEFEHIRYEGMPQSLFAWVYGVDYDCRDRAHIAFGHDPAMEEIRIDNREFLTYSFQYGAPTGYNSSTICRGVYTFPVADGEFDYKVVTRNRPRSCTSEVLRRPRYIEGAQWMPEQGLVEREWRLAMVESGAWCTADPAFGEATE